MNIVLVGLSHKTSSVETRERLAFGEAVLPAALSELVDQQTLDEGLIVSTCNRVELIASTTSGADRGLARLSDFLFDYHHVTPSDLNGQLYHHTDANAIQHLFLVVSSLDSMVVG